MTNHLRITLYVRVVRWTPLLGVAVMHGLGRAGAAGSIAVQHGLRAASHR